MEGRIGRADPGRAQEIVAPTARPGAPPGVWEELPGIRRELPGGAIVFSPGSGAGAVFVLERGIVGLQRLSADGEAMGLCLVHPGELFGEELLFGRPLQCFAEALAPSRVRRVPVWQMRGVLERHPEAVWTLAGQLHARMARLMDQMEGLGAREVRSRLARTLLELAESLGRRDGESVAMRLPFTQTKLAGLVGSTRQTVNAVLGRLEADGLIARTRDDLRLLRVEALRALAVGRSPMVHAEGGSAAEPRQRYAS